jgi:hypothetical protein
MPTDYLLSHGSTCFCRVLYVLTLFIVSMFPFRSWAHNPSDVLVCISELCGYITGIPVSHILTQSTGHHVRWSSFKHKKDSAVCCNESAQNCSTESGGNVSCSERNHSEYSVLLFCPHKIMLLSCCSHGQ